MRIELQIGLGLLPGVLAAVCFLLKRKVFRIRAIVPVLLMLSVCGSVMALGVQNMMGSDTQRNNLELSRSRTLSFANALFLQGAYDQAEEVIDDYSLYYGYDDECRLLWARICAARGNWNTVQGLYAYLSSTDLQDQMAAEAETMQQTIFNDSPNRPLVSYLLSHNRDLAEYGVDPDQAVVVPDKDPHKFMQDINTSIDEAYDIPEDYIRWVKIMSEAGAVNTGVDSDEDTENAERKRHSLSRIFDEISEQEPELLSLPSVSKARIEVLANGGDYSSVTKNISSTSNHHELLSAAELYLRGAVGSRNFSEYYAKINPQDASLLQNHLREILSDARENADAQSIRNLETKIDSAILRIKDPTLDLLKEQMLDQIGYTTDGDNSKIYLEASKIESYFNNIPGSDEYLRLALATAQESDDDPYRNAMAEIDRLITNQDVQAAQEITDTPYHVQQAVSHSTTVDLSNVPETPRNVPESQTDTPENNSETSDASEELPSKAFSRNMVDYVSRVRNQISIRTIDTDHFPEITATVQISNPDGLSVEELKKQLLIRDCGAKISSFTLEKIEYDSSDVILCCDISGSMEPNMEDLRDAVLSYIQDRTEDERISLVTFNSEIADSLSFGVSDEALIQMAQEMESHGWTKIYKTAIKCLSTYSVADKKDNILIILTDGDDNTPASPETIELSIVPLANSRNVTIYTLGLGSSVDAVYLTDLAAAGKGDFIYVSDSASLTGFYNMIHTQSKSQYRLTYTAVDTMNAGTRTLEVRMPSDGVVDFKNYYLYAPDAQSDNPNMSFVNKSVEGISPQHLFKTNQPAPASLKGSNFASEDQISVKLQGVMEYTLPAEYLDSENISLSIPANVAPGVYDVHVSINGKTRVLTDGFSVILPGQSKTTAFGPYVFTSTEKIQNSDESVTLRGCVQMNGWLNFRGEVTLDGDLNEDAKVTVQDGSGAYVQFRQDTASGFAKEMSKKDIPMSVPPLGEFYLYNDQIHINDFDNYTVDDITPGPIRIFNMITVASVNMNLYPDNFKFNLSGGTTMFPFQEKIMKFCNKNWDPFSFQADASGVVTADQLGLLIDIEHTSVEQKYRHLMNFCNAPLHVNGDLKLHVDTIKNEYSAGYVAHLVFLDDPSGVGMEASWKGWHLDSIKSTLELAKPIRLKTQIPIQITKFGFEVGDIEDYVSSGSWTSLNFTGSISLASDSITKFMPCLEKYLGKDIYILSMPDTTASLKLSPFGINLNATLKFLKEIELASAEVNLGLFDVTNPLLELRDVEVAGLRAALDAGVSWDTMNKAISYKVEGDLALDAHTRAVALSASGTYQFRFDWWMVDIGVLQSGDSALGLYFNNRGESMLFLKYTYQGDHSRGGNLYYLKDWEVGSGGTLN